ncbi:hypothetical protein [Lunatimonas sp.]
MFRKKFRYLPVPQHVINASPEFSQNPGY